MLRAFLIVGIGLLIGLANIASAQDATEKTQDLIAALDKTKYKKKEKRDIKIEIYVDVKNEAVVKTDSAEYSGLYESSDSGYRLKIRVAHDGSVTGGGYDPTINGDDSQRVDFTLKDARVEGALLTATKLYNNGQTEKLEAVFTKRSVSHGANPSNIEGTDSSFGIGFIQTHEKWTNRVFLEFRR